MKVRITKRDRRNELVCVRVDGSRTTANLGPRLPYHDLAHYVVERRFGLRRGFYGNVAAGYSIDELGDKEIIKSLHSESWVAEILARGLTSVATGACRAEQFASQVNEELVTQGFAPVKDVVVSSVDEMLSEYRELTGAFESLSTGASLDLDFPDREPCHPSPD